MKTTADTQSIEISTALESWYARHPDGALIERIQACLQPTFDRSFGYHICQMGPLACFPLVDSSPIHHRIYTTGDHPSPNASMQCHGDELPLETGSMDMLVAFHALDFDPNPHGVLREMQRVLRPSGHLVLIGFNPYSLLGVSLSARRLANHELWHRLKPVSPGRLTDWLHLVDCEVEAISHLYPLPLVGKGKLRRGIQRVDEWAARHGLPGGGLYVAHAVKRIAGVRRPRPVPAITRKPLVGLAVAGAPSPTPRQPRESSKDVAA